MIPLAAALEAPSPPDPAREPIVVDGPADLDVHIINGVAATEADWPMTGGLIVGGTATVAGYGTFEGRGLMCSSTLIAPDVVLTAAHCVDVDGLLDVAAQQGAPVESYDDLVMAFSRQASLAAWDLGASVQSGEVEDWPTDAAFASRFLARPEFDILTLQTGLAANHDIGLVFLEEPLLDVPFAILPTADEAGQLAVGMSVEVVGWGQQEQDALPGTYGTKQMGTSTISELGRQEFQVGAAFEDVRKCHGDSGGPTFVEVETDSAETWRLVGVTSHAYDSTDCRVTGGVDTRVDAHLDWIDATMRAACDDGTRSWCLEPGIIAPPDAAGLYAWERDDAAADPDAEEEADGGGCGCAAGAPAGAWLAVVGLLAARRRR